MSSVVYSDVPKVGTSLLSTRLYGGVKYTQVRHAIQCKKCLETIESKHIHDFKYCSCGAVGIDGGIFPGNSIIGDKQDTEDRSMYCAIVQNKKIWLPMSLDITKKTCSCSPHTAVDSSSQGSHT